MGKWEGTTLGDVSQLNQGGFSRSPLATSRAMTVGDPQVPILWSLPETGANMRWRRGWVGRRRGGEGKRAL